MYYMFILLKKIFTIHYLDFQYLEYLTTMDFHFPTIEAHDEYVIL